MKIEEIEKAVVEMYDDVLKNEHTAADIFRNYTTHRRYIGSKDRRKMGELFWGMLRFKAHLDYALPDGTTADKLSFFNKFNPKDMTEAPLWVQCECPKWLLPYFKNPEKELTAEQTEAPFILRVNGDRQEILNELEELDAEPTEKSSIGIKLPKRLNLAGSPLYRSGKIEVQDEGSQLICLELFNLHADKILDMCAGAGGKSLALASLMHNKGHIVAYDISERSLKELQRRAFRANATNITIAEKMPQNTDFDLVFIDAPCSGTGVWRRAPDSKWHLTPDQFQKLIQTQQELLNKAPRLVKKGGYLAYITCSLTTAENEKQTETFLNNHPSFQLVREKFYSPALTQTDGFYLAVFTKNSD